MRYPPFPLHIGRRSSDLTLLESEARSQAGRACRVRRIVSFFFAESARAIISPQSAGTSPRVASKNLGNRSRNRAGYAPPEAEHSKTRRACQRRDRLTSTCVNKRPIVEASRDASRRLDLRQVFEVRRRRLLIHGASRLRQRVHTDRVPPPSRGAVGVRRRFSSRSAFPLLFSDSLTKIGCRQRPFRAVEGGRAEQGRRAGVM